jgi:hypothetical protein
MSLNHPVPDQEISFDHAKNKKSKVSPEKIEENDLESSDLRINFGI